MIPGAFESEITKRKRSHTQWSMRVNTCLAPLAVLLEIGRIDNFARCDQSAGLFMARLQLRFFSTSSRPFAERCRNIGAEL
jgi:hypothetical protein